MQNHGKNAVFCCFLIVKICFIAVKIRPIFIINTRKIRIILHKKFDFTIMRQKTPAF